MKRILSLILLLALLLSSVNALAAAPTITNATLMYPAETWSSAIAHSNAKRLLKFNLNTEANVSASIYEASNGKFYVGVSNDQLMTEGASELWWNGVNKDGWHPNDGKSIDLILKVIAKNAEGSTENVYPFTFFSGHNMESHTEEFIPSIIEDPIQVPVVPKIVSYTHNNIRSFGPRFRDIDPQLTKQWYRFTALDLSQDGKQTFDLISGDHYIVGKVTVTVNGDSVRVDYKYDLKEIWDWKNYKFYTFFSDFDSVTSVEPLEIEKRFEYGKTYSIENDLNGDTSVLLYMANKATHTDDINLLKVFRETWKPYVQQRDAMLDMIEKTLAK